MTNDSEDEIKILTINTSDKPLPKWAVQIAPWSTASCPKSWGVYSPEHQEPGWYVNVAIDDGLASVDVESIYGPLEAGFKEAEDRAMRQLLPMLEGLNIETLTETQISTRDRAIALLRERLSIPGPVRSFGSKETP